jgi:chromosome segregation protein
MEQGGEGEPGGVAVEVKPAKKLGKRLQLLSGGERALVAIAYLMALVLARPCPFYILDEIEAALDDVNIGRLVKLLRDYRERTQFILITHQKRTMEAADVLYGVTMGADGASQVVSARMAEQEIDREAGAPGASGDDGAAARPSAAG